MKKWGNKVYVLAADYNYGQITAKWVAHYVEERKGTVQKTDFFPLDVSDFGSTIAKIQDAAPNFVCRRAGRRRAHVVLPAVGGLGHEQEDPADLDHLRRRQRAPGALGGRGRRHPDRRQLQPGSSTRRPTRTSWRAWAKRYGDTKIVHELAVSQYQGIMLWAEAVRKAGSIDRDALIKALETGLEDRRPGRNGRRSIRRRTMPRSTSS